MASPFTSSLQSGRRGQDGAEASGGAGRRLGAAGDLRVNARGWAAAAPRQTRTFDGAGQRARPGRRPVDDQRGRAAQGGRHVQQSCRQAGFPDPRLLTPEKQSLRFRLGKEL